MVQAARSGVQNIAEGSQASGTSRKMEMKLTNVAWASLEELRLDYEDFLRQGNLPLLASNAPALERFKKLCCATLEEVRAWVQDERRRMEEHGQARTSTDKKDVANLPSSALAANAALSLLNLCCVFLDRQLAAQAAHFEKNGGFTEKLYHHRTKHRRSD